MIDAFHYSKRDIVARLRDVGLMRGDHIFVHSNLGFFGKLENATTSVDYYRIFKEAIFEVIGDEGTLVVPSFTYSFLKGEEFDIDNSPSFCGIFSEMVRKDLEARRSEDANFSVCALGKLSEFFTQNVSQYSFGDDSFWHRFHEKKGKFCNFNFDAGTTYIHYVERCLGVSYRKDVPYTGFSVINGEKSKKMYYHFFRVCPHYTVDVNAPAYARFSQRAREQHLVRVANLGKGQILAVGSEAIYQFIEKEIKKDQAFLIEDAWSAPDNRAF